MSEIGQGIIMCPKTDKDTKNKLLEYSKEMCFNAWIFKNNIVY